MQRSMTFSRKLGESVARSQRMGQEQFLEDLKEQQRGETFYISQL